MFDLSMFHDVVTKGHGKRVTGVTVGKIHGKNPLKSTVTRVTRRKSVRVTKKPFKINGVTPVTHVTPQKHNNQQGCASLRW